MSNTIATLLWTGGWDSTYRLLNLLMVQHKVVQPYYVIDATRYSVGAEIRARDKIKKSIFALKPETEELLLPTVYHELTDILPRPDLSKKYWNLRKKYFMGEQYEWLARFTEQFNLRDLEMAIHLDDKVHSVLESNVEPVSENDGDSYRLKDGMDNDDYAIFKNFKFPLFNWTKLEMERDADARGFGHIMEETWFCHQPHKKDTPCGICAPCSYTIEEGMKRRIPAQGRIKYYFKKIESKLLSILNMQKQ